jgi:hypothetical protein
MITSERRLCYAQQILLKIDFMKGESRHPQHPDEVELAGFSHGRDISNFSALKIQTAGEREQAYGKSSQKLLAGSFPTAQLIC